jgi:hypothetical protein
MKAKMLEDILARSGYRPREINKDTGPSYIYHSSTSKRYYLGDYYHVYVRGRFRARRRSTVLIWQVTEDGLFVNCPVCNKINVIATATLEMSHACTVCNFCNAHFFHYLHAFNEWKRKKGAH